MAVASSSFLLSSSEARVSAARSRSRATISVFSPSIASRRNVAATSSAAMRNASISPSVQGRFRVQSPTFRSPQNLPSTKTGTCRAVGLFAPIPAPPPASGCPRMGA